MRLGGEVHDGVVPGQVLDDGVLVGDVGVDEPAAAVVDQVGDVLAIAGVGEGVEDRHRVVGGRQDVTDVVRPDEPGGAGDE